ncbi:hypothetical protein NKH98_11170 [Mesorhizobium sp. M0833]|uniref:hypothetical protein n=1 Tax=Mesorhizobium sp. M0833 TaxID=2957009 RepID=UPI0033361CA8
MPELQAAAELPLPAAARKRQHHLPSGIAALFLGHDRADRVNIHRRLQRDPADLGGDLGPVIELAGVTLQARSGRAARCLVIALTYSAKMSLRASARQRRRIARLCSTITRSR